MTQSNIKNELTYRIFAKWLLTNSFSNSAISFNRFIVIANSIYLCKYLKIINISCFIRNYNRT